MIWFKFREDWENQAQNGIGCYEPKTLNFFFLILRESEKPTKNLLTFSRNTWRSGIQESIYTAGEPGANGQDRSTSKGRRS